jgi:hypothetical protein
MWDLARAVVRVLSDVLTFGVLFLRSSSAIRAENVVLRRQLSRYIEHRLAAGALVLTKSVLGGLHHEYSLATAPADA